MKFYSLIFLFACFIVEANCDENFSAIVKQTDVLICDESTTFEKLGSLSNGYQIYNYTHLFNGGMRASNRLVISDASGILIGLYSINDWATKVSGDCISFPYSPTYGNSICLSNEKLPEKAWLDGENPSLFK
jgi:hypothetical protein